MPQLRSVIEEELQAARPGESLHVESPSTCLFTYSPAEAGLTLCARARASLCLGPPSEDATVALPVDFAGVALSSASLMNTRTGYVELALHHLNAHT